MGKKFIDSWVVEKTLYEYFNLGSGACACCSFNAFNPDGYKGLIKSMSDLETDAKDNELSAAERSPWPPDMRDQVWGERALLRFKMKKDMYRYREFFASVDVEILGRWCHEQLGPLRLKKLFQL